jgi:hypothetical protein
MALHREKRKYKTKSGKTAYRSMLVAAQGQPQVRLRLKQGGPAKSGAPRKGANRLLFIHALFVSIKRKTKSLPKTILRFLLRSPRNLLLASFVNENHPCQIDPCLTRGLF